MLVKTKIKITDEYEQLIILNQIDPPIKIWGVNFEIANAEIEGRGRSYYLLHRLDHDDEAAVLLIRGYTHFEGSVLKQKGKFLAQEDGHKKLDIVEMNGRIVDASDELMLLVGRYNFSGVYNTKELDLTFDFEL